MIKALFGTGTAPWRLRGGLAELSATHTAIATRLAEGSRASSASPFADALGEATGAAIGEQELLTNMASLADTQLRFEATARLLQRAYADLRVTMRNG